MIHRVVLTLLTLALLLCAHAQEPPVVSCGQKEVNEQFFKTNTTARNLHQQIETQLRQYNLRVKQGLESAQRMQAVVTLPVVVHIIHNNGTENISNAQVLTAIQHLNEAFANTGYYDPANGVNTSIQFCLAQRDPNNNPTNGITRDVSAYTVMGGASYYSDDQSVKNINRWDPSCYINIWVVRSIPGSVAGYAYLPAAHGSNLDGIVLEAGYFGSSYPNDVVVIHEMGHYLGLYHTFEGACTNNDCTADGDKVCDTPPDQSTASTSCNASMNSCSTDALSGFSTDMDDLTQDYMDYGNFNCMKVFTQGQADRMIWHIQNVRGSLLACKSCMTPCPAPVTAAFTAPAGPVNAGTAYTFTNTSVNAAAYDWYVNGVLKASSANFTFNFPGTGNYTIKMIAHSSNALCNDAEKTISLQAVCPVVPSFTRPAATMAAGSTINFTNTSTGADAYEWFVNGTSQATSANYSYTTNTAGRYIIRLVARNTVAGCQQEFTDTVTFTCPAVASFTPMSPATLVGTPITFTSNSTGAVSGQWIVEGSVAGTNPTLTYAFTAPGLYPVKLVVSNGTCSSEATGYVYVSDQCNHPFYLYQKNYGMGVNSGANDIQPAADGGSILATRVILNPPVSEGALLRLDPSGTLQWVHTFSNGVNSRLLKARQTADGGFITIGEIGNGQLNLFIVKTQATGAIEWSRQYAINTYASGADIVQSSDGSYYFTGSTATAGGLDVLAGRLDANGNLLWMKTYDSRNNELPVSLIEDNGSLVIAGNLPAQNTEVFLLKLQKSDGSVSWARKYISTSENFKGIQKGPDGYYLDNIRRNNALAGVPTDHVILKTDFNGNLAMTKYLRPFTSGKGVGGVGLIIKPNGNFVHQTSPEFGGAIEDIYLQEVTPSGTVLWTKRYNKPDAWMSCLAPTAENGFQLGGFTVVTAAPVARTYVMRLDTAGNTAGCPVIPVTVDLLDAAYTANNLLFTFNAIQPAPATTHTATSFTITTNVECQITKCDFVVVDTCGIPCITNGITGADSVCNRANAITYELKRNSNCPSKAAWTFDAAFIDTIATTDSTITVRFKQRGSTVLRSTLTTPCKTLYDSLTIHIFDSPVALNLGPDITLCKISTYALRAGSGFAAYRWQDGSSDSSFTLNEPGTYFVEAMDHCGNYYRDTVVVTQRPDLPFDLGPDKIVCINDTVTLTAPGGFTKYYWSPGYSINNRYSATIKVVATKDTTYTVTAEQSAGCLVMDTIRFMVRQPLPVKLGNDTSLCRFDTLTLQASAGFSQYTWSTGATTQAIRVAGKGKYVVTARDANNCQSRDTLEILNVFDPPAGFLMDAAICPGEVLDLKAPAGFSSYRWFNNTTAGSVQVTSPGNYWLQVTDARGCEGIDTALVTSKICGKGVYFPNAFSPNNDAVNNEFRPVVRGALQQYHLIIFNRWGEKVFETKDAARGWDGSHKNRLQPTGTFVWVCKYKLMNEAEQIVRGTVTLIRYR